MKKLQLFIACLLVSVVFMNATNAAVDPSTTETYATDPALPVVDQALTIYVNVDNWDITDKDTITAHTGTVTTASNSKTDWRNVKADWNEISIPMTKENDSVYSLTIADINTFYGVPADEEVVRIAFIARGTKNGAVSNGQQTSDLFIDVFADEPTNVFSFQPANASDKDMVVVTFNINDTINPDRNELQGYTDTTYIHTWANDGLGTYVGPGWGDNDAKWMCDAVNDSIRRFYFAPTVRGLLDMSVSASVGSLGILIRNKEANGQTNDFTIDLDSDVDVDLSMVDPILMVPEFPTQDDPIYIYIDAKNYESKGGGKLDPASTLSTWSGIITSASSDKANWRHQVNAEWGGFGDSTLLERVNDTIHRWAIPSLSDKYGVDLGEEDVFRIAMIARDTVDGVVKNQTDDLLFEVFGELPTDTTHTSQPAMLTQDKAFVITFNPENADHDNSLFSLLDTNMADTVGVWAHTGVKAAAYSDDIKDWQYVIGSDWGVNTSDNEAVVVSSNLVRFFVYPDAPTLYDVADSLEVLGVNILLRDETGAAQTADLFIPFDTAGYNLPLKPEVISVNEITQLEGVLVYPNPVNDVLYVQFDEAKSASITFINAVGQVVYTQNIVNEQIVSINVNEFANSNEILFYTIQSENKVVTQKLLVK